MRSVLIGPVHPYRGGIAHYTTMLHRALCQRGHEVLLVSFKRQYPQRLFPGASDKDPSEEPLRVRGAHYWIDSLNPITWVLAFWRIYGYRPDTIVLQWWTTFWAPAWFVIGGLLRLFLRRPLVILCHNVLPHEARWWDVWLTRLVLRWGTRFIVQSPAEERQLAALLPDARVSIAPHPVYDMFAGDRVDRQEARRKLDLPMETPVLLFFGIVREYKGLLDVLAALPQVRARVGPVTLVVAGEIWGDKRPYLAKIEQLGIGDAVILEDRYIPNETVALYFSAADVLVAPYRRVTGSGAIQMARGLMLPVITTTVCTEAETAIADGKAGRVVPPDDPETLANAIASFCQSRPTDPKVHDQGSYSWVDLVDLIAASSDAADRPETRR